MNEHFKTRVQIPVECEGGEILKGKKKERVPGKVVLKYLVLRCSLTLCQERKQTSNCYTPIRVPW